MDNTDKKGILAILSGNSGALSRYIANRPDLADEVTASYAEDFEVLFPRLETSLNTEIDNAIDNDDIKRCEGLLRRFKYSLLCALSIRYLSHRIDTVKFGASWSRTAETCCRAAFRFAFQHIVHEMGRPVARADNGDETDFRFTVLAAGKLGAEELNLSSDIDLIFIYNTDNGYVEGSPKRSLNEFASKLSALITSIISKRDQNGFCFRVDTDLRPEGSRGPIANSIDAAVRFYETWGSEMERMMLIRAHPIAGDCRLGKEFIKRVKPFIYRRSLDAASIGKIRETKYRITQESMKSKKKGINIKLGPGCIRSAEFVVQSLQLIHGGKNEKVTSRNTTKALDAIKLSGYLPPRQCDQLKEAYLFLRHAENMLQLDEEEQTHLLPADQEKWKTLARQMGYVTTQKRSAESSFAADLDRYTGIIKHHFQHMFEVDTERHQMEEAIFSNISTCRNQEEEIDSLAWFKREETKRIRYKDLEEDLSAEQVSERLSLVAEVIISEAYKIAYESLREIHGPPLTAIRRGPNAGLAIIGMGKLGGREIDYASDLDLMFIYSDTGETAGPKRISNQEYFTRLSQRIISLITLPTRYGRAYQIDADLRPSGRAGVLVTPIAAFKNYHLTEAMIWERQALIKARPVAGDPKFSDDVYKEILDICFEAELPPNFAGEIFKLRRRMEIEKAKEGATRYNIKLGAGGLMDIETIAQYLQLIHGRKNKELRANNTLKTLRLLAAGQLINEDEATLLVDGYGFFRKLLGRIRLFSNHATDYLDTNSNQLAQIAKSLGFNNQNDLIGKYMETRKGIREIYNSYSA